MLGEAMKAIRNGQDISRTSSLLQQHPLMDVDGLLKLVEDEQLLIA